MGVLSTILTGTLSLDSILGKIVQTFTKPVADYCFRNLRAEAERPLRELELKFYEKTKEVDFRYMRDMEALRRQSRFELAAHDSMQRLREAQQRYLLQNGKDVIQADNQNVWPLTGHLANMGVTNGQSLKPTLFLTKPDSATKLGELFGAMQDMVSTFLSPYTSCGDYTSRFGAWREGFDSDENIRAVCFMQQGEPALVLNPKMNNAGQVHFRFASWGVGQKELTPSIDNFASFIYDEFRGVAWRDLVISLQRDQIVYGEPTEALKTALGQLEQDQVVIGNRTDEDALNLLAQRWRYVVPDTRFVADLRSRMSAVIGGVLGIQTALRLDIYNLVERQIEPKLPRAFAEYLRNSSRFLGGGALELPREISSSYCAALRQLAYLGCGPSLFLKVARSLTGFRDTATLLLREGVGVWACEKNIGQVSETPSSLDAAVQLVHDYGKEVDGSFVKDVDETVKALSGDEKLSATKSQFAIGAPIDKSRKAGERMIVKIKSVEVAFRWCPSGAFIMGSPQDEEERYKDETQHQVTLTRGFWMAETQTTQKLWKVVMGKNPSRFKWFSKTDLFPVERVSWEDCKKFIEMIQPYAPKGMEFKLPTEAQWEYACRAGTTTPFSFGSVLNGDKANCAGEKPYGTKTKGKYIRETTPVGSYGANPWGLYDMHGNVWEWCADRYGDYPQGAVTDPTGAQTGGYRVLRGGSWLNYPRLCRSANRDYRAPAYRNENHGFRLLLTDK